MTIPKDIILKITSVNNDVPPVIKVDSVVYKVNEEQ